jgi:cytidylate kinase
MATRIVTISHATGAGGDGIGRSVADRLGFRYVDEEIIEIAAKKHGLDATTVADAERRKNLLARENGDRGDSRRVDATKAERENLLPRDAARWPTYRVSGLVQRSR